MNVERSAARGAVFLSYASQDADAVRRICESLRAAGIEVWFDQSELVGGDTWDAKIRKQIKGCALFVPVISASTQARLEGYFRIEWKLAAQRTHAMAEAKPFLLPVVIDATGDADAHVPEEFRAVQWTRLPAGEANAPFCARVKTLLGVEVGPVSDRPHSRGEGAASPPIPPARRRVPAAAWIAAAAVIVGGSLYFALRPEKNADARIRPLTTEKSPALISEARKLAAKADAMFDQDEDATRDTLDLAETLCKQAITLDPFDAVVRAVYSRLHRAYISYGYDRSPERIASARAQAEHAVKLDARSDEAQFALANVYRSDAATQAEAERILRDLVARRPDDKRALRMLGMVCRLAKRSEEALAIFTRSTELPGGDPVASRHLGNTLIELDRMEEAETAIDRAIASSPNGALLVQKVFLAMRRGDLVAVRASVEKISGPALIDPLNAGTVTKAWLWLKEPKKALSIWGSLTQDYVENGIFTGPKDYLIGVVLDMDGRPDAAALAWRTALQVVEKRLVNQPNSRGLIGWKGVLLWRLGEREDARRALTLYGQLPGNTPIALIPSTTAARVAIGERGPLVETVRNQLRSPNARANLRFDPEFEAARREPWFQQLLAEAEQKK